MNLSGAAEQLVLKAALVLVTSVLDPKFLSRATGLDPEYKTASDTKYVSGVSEVAASDTKCESELVALNKNIY
ncbi:6202_t:CDS:2 [Racocetra fulgida]|uniref:6202_t:CDS:1 n=1 Tax=Racocetra fulgida TaxID=60492 RepID=A0A9N8WIT8_9GLOM|nr:6202_t:CDS:2 [Racocetra fulgida]